MTWLDLAVVEIDGSNVNKVATLGDSSKLRKGEKQLQSVIHLDLMEV